MSYPPQPPGPYGNQPDWGQQPYQPQDQSQDFWRQVASGTQPHSQQQFQQGPNQAYPQDPYAQNPHAQSPYAQNPYAQDPYAPNPYGQQPYPQNQYGQPPPKKRRVGLIVGLVFLGLAVVGGGVGVALMAAFSGSEIKAGDCLELKNERGGRVVKADCGSSQSDYQVVEVVRGSNLDACPKNYSNAWQDQTYCMVLDVKVGDCLSSFSEDEGVLPVKADCSAPNTEDQVTKVEKSSDSESICSKEEGYYVFEEPARTVCFGDVTGA